MSDLLTHHFDESLAGTPPDVNRLQGGPASRPVGLKGQVKERVDALHRVLCGIKKREKN